MGGGECRSMCLGLILKILQRSRECDLQMTKNCLFSSSRYETVLALEPKVLKLGGSSFGINLPIYVIKGMILELKTFLPQRVKTFPF